MAEMTWQQKLEYYKAHPDEAQAEIERAKSVWEQKMKAGDKAGADAAHRWADQVRAASGIANDDPTYGNDPRTYKGSKSSSSLPPFLQQPPMFQPPDLSGAGIGTSSDLLKMFMGMMGGGGLSTEQQRDIRKSAQQRAAQEQLAYQRQLQALQAQQQAALGNIVYGQRQLMAQRMGALNNFMQNMAMMNAQKSQEQAALEAMMKQYGINRDTGLQQIENATEDAKQALENRSFQDYLQSRQNIANRGLSGSGIAADADTRLMLAKQQDMAGIMRDAATRKADLEAKFAANVDKTKAEQAALQQKYGANLMKLLGDMSNSSMSLQNQMFKLMQDRGNIFSQFAPQFGSIYDKMAQINPQIYEQEMLGKAQSSADGAALKRMQILSTLIGKMLPYDAMTLNQMAQLGLNYDKLNSGNLNDLFDRMLNYQNNQDNLGYKYDALNQQRMLDYIKMLGMFPDGTPTLDARKLAQQQAYQQQLLALRQQGLINDQQYRDAMLQLNAAKFDESRMQNDRRVLVDAISAVDREIAALSSRLAQDPNAAGLRERLNQLQGQKIYLMNQLTGTPMPLPPLGYTDNGVPIQGPPNPKR